MRRSCAICAFHQILGVIKREAQDIRLQKKDTYIRNRLRKKMKGSGTWKLVEALLKEKHTPKF